MLQMQLVILKMLLQFLSFVITFWLRERAEEGQETSVPKLTKLGERSSPVSKCTEPTASSVWNSGAEQHQKQNNTLDPNPNFALEDTGKKLMKESYKLPSDKTDTKITCSETHAPKKRKELEDLSEDTESLEIVFGSRDLVWEDQMADHDQEAQGNTKKKRYLEDKGSWIQEGNVKQREENKILVSYILLMCLILKFTTVLEGY